MIARWLLLALVVLVPVLAEAFIVVTPPGVTCAADTRLTAPVAGQDYCFESTSNTLNNWSGAAWVPITLGGSQQSTNALTGLTLANNVGDPTNDIDIALGLADSDDAVIGSRQQMSLTTALTKQLDVAWAVGTNQGMRSGAALANGTWHIFLIKRTDTGVVDIFADTSLTPTLPTNYTKKRRIGSIVRVAGAIKAFHQHGDWFDWDTPVLDVDSVAPGTSAVTATLTVPIGFVVIARIAGGSTAGSNAVYWSALDTTDLAPSLTVAPLATMINFGAGTASGGSGMVRTNTLGQVRFREITNNQVYGVTLGWIDHRGREN